MKILLTNDDGIESPGLQVLAGLIRQNKNYSLVIIAPDRNRSAISHSINIFLDSVNLIPLSEDVWTCSGSPADCVIAAVLGSFCEKPDLVISGINQGANLGTDIVYSGTASAARQASIMGIPGIALSLYGKKPFFWDMAASWALDSLEELVTYWKENTFVNINIPNSREGPIGLMHTWPGIKNYIDSLDEEKTGEGLVCKLISGGEIMDYEEGSDCEVVTRNYVSVSTLSNLPVIIKESCPLAPAYASTAGRPSKRS